MLRELLPYLVLASMSFILHGCDEDQIAKDIKAALPRVMEHTIPKGMFKLVYFKTQGRVEPIRLLGALGKVPLRDQYIETNEEWRSVAKPYYEVPVLVLPDGTTISQTRAILHFMARIASLTFVDAVSEAKSDEIAEAAFDLWGYIDTKIFAAPNEGDRLKAIDALPSVAKKWLPVWNKILASTDFFVGPNPHLADVVAFRAVSDYSNHVGRNALKDYPDIARWFANFRDLPEIKKYIEGERHLPSDVKETETEYIAQQTMYLTVMGKNKTPVVAHKTIKA